MGLLECVMKKCTVYLLSILNFCSVYAQDLPDWFNNMKMIKTSGCQLRLDKINREIVADINNSKLRQVIIGNSVYNNPYYNPALNFMKQKGIDDDLIKFVRNQETEEYKKLIYKLDVILGDDKDWLFYKKNNRLQPEYINIGCYLGDRCIFLSDLLNKSNEAKLIIAKQFNPKMKKITASNIKKIKANAKQKHLDKEKDWILFNRKVLDIDELEWSYYFISAMATLSEANMDLRKNIDNELNKLQTDLENYKIILDLKNDDSEESNKAIQEYKTNIAKYTDLRNKYNQLNEAFLNRSLYLLDLIEDNKTEGQLIAEKIIHKHLENEIYESSRKPNEKENEDLKDLRTIADKYDINEIRIIDAESLIKSFNCREDEKNYLINLVRNGTVEEVEHEIDLFMQNSKFEKGNDSLYEKESLRKDISNVLKNGAKTSPVYRDEILTLIAWSKAKSHKACDANAFMNTRKGDLNDRTILFKLSESKDSSAYYNQIKTAVVSIVNEKFYGLSRDTPYNYLGFEVGKSIIFHEIGHVLSESMAIVADVYINTYLKKQSKDINMEIAGESIIVYENNIIENLLAKAFKPVKYFIDYIIGSRLFNFMKEKLIEVFDLENSKLYKRAEHDIKLIKKINASNAFYARVFMFHYVSELFQIMGIMTHTHNGKNVLYFNKLSDCYNSVCTGDYIRINHFAYESGDTLLSRFSSNILKPFIHYLLKGKVGINLNFYNAVIKAYGYDPDDYFKRLEENNNQ